MLVKVDFDIMRLSAQVVDPFKGLWHKRCREVLPEVIEAHAH